MKANPTLDQLQVFLTIAETGSFSRTARQLGRAQSAISYTVANLESQLNLKLFEREGTREPRLTAAGKAMLPDARRMIGVLQDLRARASGLTAGLEAELAIAVDALLPSPALIQVLRDFEDEFPTVALRLSVGAIGIVWRHLSSGEADITYGGRPIEFPPDLVSVRIGQASITPVATPDHPLAIYPGRVPLSVVREHRQLVISDVSRMAEGRDFAVFAYKTWRMSDVGTKHQLIRSGLGWGGLPTWMIKDDIAAGRLKALNLEPYPPRSYVLYANRRADSPPGPAGTWMIDRFKLALQGAKKSKAAISIL